MSRRGRLSRLVRIVGAELHQQHAAPGRQQIEIGRALRAQAIDHRALEAFEADRRELENLRHVVGGLERVGIAEPDERPVLRAVNQRHLGFEDDGARAFAADQGARDVKSVLGQQLVEVVAGDTARDPGKLRANAIRMPVAKRPQPRVDLAAAAALPHDGVELRVARRAHRQFGAVVEEDPQLLDVVDGLPGQQRVRAAGVVADHAAERAAAVRRRIRTERELVRLGAAPQRVEHDTRLDAREPAFRIDLQNAVHVLREVEDHRDVAALAGEAGAGAARQNRRAESPARRDRGRDVFGIARHDEADRNLAVVRGVGRVQRAAARVEADFPAHRLCGVPVRARPRSPDLRGFDGERGPERAIRSRP